MPFFFFFSYCITTAAPATNATRKNYEYGCLPITTIPAISYQCRLINKPINWSTTTLDRARYFWVSQQDLETLIMKRIFPALFFEFWQILQSSDARNWACIAISICVHVRVCGECVWTSACSNTKRVTHSMSVCVCTRESSFTCFFVRKCVW